MSSGMLQGLATLLLMAGFIGLCVWVFLPRQRRRFDEAARIVLHDDGSDADGN